MASRVDPELLDEAVTLARRAGELTLQHFRSADLRVTEKGDGTPVTVADRDAERLIRRDLAGRHPGDGVVGEEEDEKPSTSGRRWIIDPLDGTKAFIRGVPLYANLLAVEDEEGIAVGVINLPALGETVYAGRGLGCFNNGIPVSVSRRTALEGSYLSTSGLDHWDDATLRRVNRSGVHVRTWGDGYGYALVATGRIEAMVDPVAALHDLAPMPVILAEAEGRFSDWSGRPIPASGTGLATN
ncbi:MAG TPA: inositol monophosphatase family protein, partial [Acidimicrobiales bacterium]|nr:inositol monophosphatase family protein [Acidimicrobiales bacterium]